MVPKITREALKQALDQAAPIVLVEALPERHWLDQRLPGAINLPHDQVVALAPRLLPDKDADIVVYCANAACANSGIAAQQLVNRGYTRVRTYHEGKQDWIEAGLPTESGPASLAA